MPILNRGAIGTVLQLLIYVVLNTDDIRISPCISKSVTCRRSYDQ